MQNEIEKFDAFGQNWWNTQSGEFRLLHKINPLRIEFVKDCLLEHFKLKDGQNVFQSLSVLDVGCGGGLASIPMARLGAKVTGIDPSEKAILAAKNKSKGLGLDNVKFIHALPENFVTSQKFDVILCLDVVEHVENIEIFLEVVANLLAPGGAIIVSSINKTPKAFLHAILAAEYVLRMLPRGTHTYDKFIRPSQLQNALGKYGIKIGKLKGIELSLLRQKWQFTSDISVNYLAYLA